jgi:hypothetical protein
MLMQLLPHWLLVRSVPSWRFEAPSRLLNKLTYENARQAERGQISEKAQKAARQLISETTGSYSRRYWAVAQLGCSVAVLDVEQAEHSQTEPQMLQQPRSKAQRIASRSCVTTFEAR